ncbi:hypothetical protein Bca4012_009240 [Brassica carinata]
MWAFGFNGFAKPKMKQVRPISRIRGRLRLPITDLLCENQRRQMVEKAPDEYGRGSDLNSGVLRAV